MIYVDKIKQYTTQQIKPAARRCGHQWCHMTTDGPDEELHQFAEKLGLRRSYFQGPPNHYPHYDLVPSLRKKAILLGAKEK